jgi:glycosidase
MKNMLIYPAIAAMILFLQGCGSNNDIPVAEQPQMIRLSSPILIDTDSTVILLSDYLRNPGRIDSIKTDESLTTSVSADSSALTICAGSRNIPRLSVMTIWSDGFSYSLLLEKSTKTHFRFTFDPKNKKYKRMQLAGQMNEWNPSSGWMFLKDGKWHIDLFLFPGKYQYKLVADNKWITDPGNPDSVSNNNGGFNSLMVVGHLNQSQWPGLYTKKAEGRKVVLGTRNEISGIFVFWENHLLDSNFVTGDSAAYTITIPEKAKDFDRSFIRAWSWNTQGTSNEILIPLQKGKVIVDPKVLTRSDKEAMIIYFMMVDRFYNGDSKNDSPVNDPEIDPKVNYQGGDLAGITKKIEEGYFTSLGVNTLWISPVTQNPLTGYTEYPAPHRKYSGYHGYWPITLTTIDTRFGTPEEMHTLVEEAHDKKMNVLLDFVSHHVHQEYPLLKDHPDWITEIDLPGNRKNIRLWDEQRLTTWFDVFLPTFDLTKPEVADLVSDSAVFWIKTYNLDGFRHDAAKHVPENYWRTLNRKLNAEVVIPDKRSLYQIGETFGSRELVGSYVNPGMLDAQFEFNLYWDAKNSFAFDQTSFRDLNYSLQQSFGYFGEHNLMGNITGNQDMSRFITLASGAISAVESDVEAGWKREIIVKDTTGYRKLASLIAFNMTIPGIPVIYYGDEFGMAGAGDPDNRRMMQFDSLNKHEQNLKSITARLAELRNHNLALTYGDMTTLQVSDKIFVYIRSYFDQFVVVVFNKDRSERTIGFEMPARFSEAPLYAVWGHPFSADHGKVSISLPANSFEIITLQAKE